MNISRKWDEDYEVASLQFLPSLVPNAFSPQFRKGGFWTVRDFEIADKGLVDLLNSKY